MNNDDKRDQHRVELARSIRRLREEMPMQLELQQLLARITKAKYDALVAEGFTPDQALTICKGT
jgi:hypothetical protein